MPKIRTKSGKVITISKPKKTKKKKGKKPPLNRLMKANGNMLAKRKTKKA
jgi:hypothetical protein